MGQESGSSVSVSASAQAAGDCCEDAETAVKTGKLCKTDTPCSSFSAFVTPSFLAPLTCAQASVLAPALTERIATFDPAGIWRPPTSI